jgi:hypothetical protein
MSDGPQIVVLAQVRVRAKQEYQCEYCKGPIRVKDYYYRVSYTEDGELKVVRVHSIGALCIPDQQGEQK